MNGTSATSNPTTPMTVKQTVREIDGDFGEGFLKRIIFANTAYCWKKKLRTSAVTRKNVLFY